MKQILAPHKDQDGWVYWRLKTTSAAAAATAPPVNPLWLVRKDTLECVKASDVGIGVGYMDDTTGSRIISSRRVEEAVETADYLKKCDEEGISPQMTSAHGKFSGAAGWWIIHEGVIASGHTLREAYHRFHAAVVE